MGEHHTNTNTTRIHTIYIAIIILLILALAGEFFYFHAKGISRNYAMRTAGKSSGPGMRMGMTPQKPPAESDQQKQQLTTGTETTTTQKTFNITAGNFYFVPNIITVNKGDQVTFVMTNVGGFHDIAIDELGVKTLIVKTGEVASASFTASKSGSFIFYCTVKGHRQKGMWGTLTVK